MPARIRSSRRSLAALILVTILLAAPYAAAQTTVTTPEQQFGFDLGADYQLATYQQLGEYWTKLDRESERMILDTIGTTAEGRAMLMAVITSPENHRRLARYKEIARRLALADGLSDEEARALAREGRTVVWIDGGLHATEVLGAQQLMETVYQMVSRDDAETRRFLDDVIMLAVHANPDGHDLVADWYMREAEPAKRSTAGVPRLYQKYIGHDNNRDFYMVTQPETEAMARVMYHEWFPQIVYNHHQTGPAGTVLFAPPFRDPFNYNLDPLVPLGIDLVGAAMHNRFVAENKPGATMRSGASYSTWWNGGLRTTVYFHNMIGLLTETIGNPTPIEIPFLPERQLPSGDLPLPVTPQTWHFRQSVDYSVTANRAVLDVASKHREHFLFNIYRMGRNSIERGSRDHWTMYPRRIEAVQAAVSKAGTAQARAAGDGPDVPFAQRGVERKFYELLREPANRDARGYIIPSSQADFLTATKFANALRKTGITVHRATSAFRVAGKSYPAGSYVVKTAQAFRPHVLDMFEPQDHPNDIPYPGGPPKPPYDNAGWTLAYQMGIEFDRILDAFNGPFEKIEELAKAPNGTVSKTRGAAGYLLGHQVNDAFIAVNRLLAGGEQVYWLTAPLRTRNATHPAGTFFITAGSATAAKLEKLAAQTGISFTATTSRPKGDALKLRPVRIGLWDRYGGSMPSGWVRWLFERFEFPFEVVYARTLDAGDLVRKYDVLIFVDGAIPQRDEPGTADGRANRLGALDSTRIPQEYRAQLGGLTITKTVPQIRAFLELGGTVIAIGGSTSLATHLGLPIESALVERGSDGVEKRLPREKYYIPGSLLRVRVDSTLPIAHGMRGAADVMFDNSPVFRLTEGGGKGAAVGPVAWFDSPTPLRSGWAWGQKYLDGGVAVAEAKVGAGRLFLFGPEITFRAQPHGTFKFLFNGIYYGSAERVTLR